MAKKSEGAKLAEKLTFEFPNIAKASPKDMKDAEKFCKGYMAFLDEGKTERECTAAAERILKKAGYTVFDPQAQYQAGDRIYYINRGKNIILTTIGQKPLTEGVKFNIAHIDSPRLDLKPNPLYEQDELAYFKTHYNGGIRKYQWGVTPLSMHGVVMLKNGKKVEISIGEKEDDPKFVISDLLPHLSAKQNERPLKEGLRGEELNIIIGSLPYQDEEVKEPFKLMALKLLNDRYGITEQDFFRAEIEMVPAVKACDIGLDRSMIGAYGQDDRVCAYTALMAAIDVKKPKHTTVTVFTEKEEVGSPGNTGMEGRSLEHFMEDLCDCFGVKPRDVYRRSMCLSSDVNAAYDPTFADVYEKRNSCFLNHGPVLTKYTGARGKNGSNDASAEFMYEVIRCTIAVFMGDMDVDTVDLGVPVLAMHSPFEITAKLDVYYTYKAFKAFYK